MAESPERHVCPAPPPHPKCLLQLELANSHTDGGWLGILTWVPVGMKQSYRTDAQKVALASLVSTVLCSSMHLLYVLYFYTWTAEHFCGEKNEVSARTQWLRLFLGTRILDPKGRAMDS